MTLAAQESGNLGSGSLEGRVALVTGAGRGIGRAIAIAMARAGATLIINDLPGGAGAAETLSLIRDVGRTGIVIPADVSSHADVDRLFERAVEEFGQIDLLVNNACRGVGDARWSLFDPDPETTVAAMPVEWWHKTIDACLSSAFYCSRAAVRFMVPAGRGGKIINIGSIHGLLTTPKFSPYAVAKAGIAMLTKGLAVELAPWKINVNCIAPGAIASEDPASPMVPEGVEGYRRRIPWGARGTPDDIADVAVFLASDAARYITGQTLYVDGGYSVDGTLPEFRQYIHPVPPADPDLPRDV
jgi:NAD(P)-dependent dehydrogenase (short-subunit alcohol dehydrogenase family)